MRKKGFTLIELLAVIVVLGIIMVIAGTYVSSQKKKANVEEAKKIESSITDLGAMIYSYESSLDSSAFMDAFKKGSVFKISVSTLVEAGYLDSEIENPNGSGTCDGFLVVNPSSTDEMFTGYINCENVYATDQSGNTYSDEGYSTREGEVSNFEGSLNSIK